MKLESFMSEQNDIFIARQPILDSNQEIFGFELFSRSSQGSEKSEIEHTVESDTEMLFNILSTFEIEKLLDNKRAFINCTLESLSVDNFDWVSSSGVTLEIKRPANVTPEMIVEVADKMKVLIAQGFTIAADDFVLEDAYSSWIPHVAYIKIQANETTSNFAAMVHKAKMLGKKIIAEKVETPAQYTFFSGLKVDFFQGYFFCKPMNMGAKITSPAVSNLIRLINMTIQEADLAEIEKVLKTDPTLSFKLLRYINSAGMGLSRTVESFKHALMILGYKKLFKWLTILFSTTNKNPGANAVAKIALTRARFLELLGTEKYGKNASDNCFVIGIFSLLDVMLNVQLEVALGSISLQDSVIQALLHGDGEYFPLVQLMLALENNDWIEILASAQVLGIPENVINEHYVNAIEWANGVSL